MSLGAADITLVVPCFNGEPYLARTLEGCTRQTVPPHELLVVDDGSTDGSATVARSFPVRVLTHRRNRGIAAARNTALAAIRTPLVAFVDADAVPDPALIEGFLRAFADDGVVGVGGRGREDQRSTLADRWRCTFWQQNHGDEPLADAWMVMGLCCAFRVAAVRDIGGFDPRYTRAGEDVDVSLRLRATGGRLVYRPELVVRHVRRDGWRSLARMVALHSSGQVHAVHRNGLSTRPHHLSAVRWWVVSTGSSLRRHRSPSLAAMSVVMGAVSIGAKASARWGG